MGLLFVGGWVHKHDLPLEFLVVTLEGFLLTKSFFNGNDKLSTQFLLLIEVGNLVHAIAIIIVIHITIVILST
jgi:hypothetical protein